jgi:ABC-type anion transport system duplicated permease subunit
MAVSLDYMRLPYYAFRTTLRMFTAIAASLVFTFVYATIAAKSRRAAASHTITSRILLFDSRAQKTGS